MSKKNEKKWELSKQFGRDIHGNPFFVALCPHGIGHHKGIHICDGCCKDAPKEIWDEEFIAIVSKEI